MHLRIREYGDEPVSLGPVILLMPDRTQPQLGSQKPQHHFHIRQHNVRAPQMLCVRIQESGAQTLHSRMGHHSVGRMIERPLPLDSITLLIIRHHRDIVMLHDAAAVRLQTANALPDEIQTRSCSRPRQAIMQLAQLLRIVSTRLQAGRFFHFTQVEATRSFAAPGATRRARFGRPRYPTSRRTTRLLTISRARLYFEKAALLAI